MITAVAGSSSPHVRKDEQAQGPDALTAKRLAESRQLAIAAMNQQQRARMQQAVAAYMSLAVSAPDDGTPASMPLIEAQRAYSEF